MGGPGFVYGKFFSDEPGPADYSIMEIPPGACGGAGGHPSGETMERRKAGHKLYCLRQGEREAARFWLGFSGSCKYKGTEHPLPDGSPYVYGLSAGPGGGPDSVFNSAILKPLLLCLQGLFSAESVGRLMLCTNERLRENEAASTGLYHVAEYSSLAPRLSCTPLVQPQGIPEKAVYLFRTRVPAFTSLAARALSASSLRKYVIEGTLAGQRLRIAFNGPKAMASYYSGVIFSQAKSDIRPMHFGITLAGSHPIDMEARWFARAAGMKPSGTVLPSFCRSILSLRGSFDDYVRSLPKSATSDIKKIQASGFEPAISRDFIDFLIFYHSMYLPMVGIRHRNHSLYLSFGELADFFNNGFILFVKRGRCPVAGLISVEQGSVIWGKTLGIAAGSSAHTKAGANSAVVYYLIKHAYGQRLGTVDLGYSSPFMSDGVLRFKAKWGARLVADRDADFLCLDFRNGETKRRFFSALSPLTLDSLEIYDPPGISSLI